MHTCFTDLHICVGITCPVHMYALHPQKGISKQDRTLFTGSHVHIQFSCVCLIDRRANILQVNHHVNWFTSRSSIVSSNEHISFTIADPVQTVPPMHTIFTNANPVHKFTSISYTHTRSSTVQMCTSCYTTKDIGSITFECVQRVRKVS